MGPGGTFSLDLLSIWSTVSKKLQRCPKQCLKSGQKIGLGGSPLIRPPVESFWPAVFDKNADLFEQSIFANMTELLTPDYNETNQDWMDKEDETVEEFYEEEVIESFELELPKNSGKIKFNDSVGAGAVEELYKKEVIEGNVDLLISFGKMRTDKLARVIHDEEIVEEFYGEEMDEIYGGLLVIDETKTTDTEEEPAVNSNKL